MRFLVIILVSTFFFLTSCKNDKCESTQKEVKKLMKTWYLKKISFPENMEVLTERPFVKNRIPREPKIAKYTIVHFFTADCDKCIDELSMIQKSLKSNLDNKNVAYIFIASAPTNVYVLNAIKKIKFPYPIYYEKEYYSFKTMNALPLSESVYDTMLLNSKQEVLLFGAFYDNEKAKKIYSQVIKCGL